MMDKSRISVIAGTLAILMSASVFANAAGPVFYHHEDKATIPGHKIEILHGMAVGIDCSIVGSSQFEIVTQPSHGRLSETKQTFFPTFQPPNPRTKCNGRRLPGIVMYYTPSGNFMGHDFVEARIGYYDGGIVDEKIDIDVK